MEGDPAASIEARVRAIDVDEARRALAAEGVAVIRGVVPSDLLQSCLHAARDEVTAEAFYSCSHHNAFLVPDDHPAALADPKVGDRSSEDGRHPRKTSAPDPESIRRMPRRASRRVLRRSRRRPRCVYRIYR